MPSPRNQVVPVLAAFGERVRSLRHAANFTQDKLAERAHVQPLFIRRIETQNANPSLATIALIAAALGCSIRDMFPERD